MIQGTGSNVGKSLLVAGLCRHFTNQGLKVRPFKPQNMSNNAAVTESGGEIGRAQALQARACRTASTVDMNPVLLKPEGETGSQVIVRGQNHGAMKAADYYKIKQTLLPEVMASFEALKQQADLVIVEGAGSASEVNLRQNDIANMGFALAANLPVIILGDIDRGGVIANLVGTSVLLDRKEHDLIKGFIINKFRGDPALFTPAITLIEEKTGWPNLGICPWFEAAVRLPAEDSQDLGMKPQTRTAPIKIIVPLLPRIANFDDLDPLIAEPDVTLEMIKPGRPLPIDADLIILPGSKATHHDLKALRNEGWDIDIRAHHRRGGVILGLCGGYQMLGKKIDDPDGIEGPPGTINGIGLLDVTTRMAPAKTLKEVNATYPAAASKQAELKAYEMHMGETEGPDRAAPLFLKHNPEKTEEPAGHDSPEGAISTDGRVMGTYLHGLFVSDSFRRTFLKKLGAKSFASDAYETTIDQTLDALGHHLASHLNLERLIETCNLKT